MAGDEDGRSDTGLFVSYSRRDEQLVLATVSQLAELGARVWIDTADIEKSDDWWESICGGIREADAVVAFLTPDYMRSAVCRNELEYARSAGKRIVPVAARGAEALDEVPEWLKAINWLGRIKESDETQSIAAEIIRISKLDHDWTREHSRLLARATEWDRAGRVRSRLLRGGDVTGAERQLEASRAEEQAQPSELQRAYVMASRRRRNRVRSALLSASAVITVVSIGLAVLAQRNAAEATRQRDIASLAQIEAETALNSSEYQRLLLTAQSGSTLRDRSNSGLEAVATGTAAVIPRQAMAGELFALASDATRPIESFSVAPYAPFSYGADQGLALSENGGVLAYVSEGDIRIVDLVRGDPVRSIPNPGVSQVAISSDGSTLFGARGGADGSLSACVVAMDSARSRCSSVQLELAVDSAASSVIGVSFGVDPNTAIVALSLGELVLVRLDPDTGMEILQSSPAILEFRSTVGELNVGFSSSDSRICFAGDVTRLIEMTTLSTVSDLGISGSTPGPCIATSCANTSDSFWARDSAGYVCLGATGVELARIDCFQGCATNSSSPVPIVGSTFPAGIGYSQSFQAPCNVGTCVVSVTRSGRLEVWRPASEQVLATATEVELPIASRVPIQSSIGESGYIENGAIVTAGDPAQSSRDLRLPTDFVLRTAFESANGTLVVQSVDGALGRIDPDTGDFVSWSTEATFEVDLEGDHVVWVSGAAVQVLNLAESTDPDSGTQLVFDSGAPCSLDLGGGGLSLAVALCSDMEDTSIISYQLDDNSDPAPAGEVSVPFQSRPSLSTSRDGSVVAVHSFGVLAFVKDGEATVAPQFAVSSQVTNEFVASDFEISADGQWLLSLQNVNGLRLWTLQDLELKLAAVLGSDYDWPDLGVVRFENDRLSVLSGFRFASWSLSLDSAEARLCRYATQHQSCE